ncbi:MAG: pentapeptide MXKDX repeat protein [Pseudolabrys sp.]
MREIARIATQGEIVMTPFQSRPRLWLAPLAAFALFAAVPAASAQGMSSGDKMQKSDGMKNDAMKKDNMGGGAMKKDGMKSDAMKSDAMKKDGMGGKMDGKK